MKNSDNSAQRQTAKDSNGIALIIRRVLFPACLMYAATTLLLTGAASFITSYAPSFQALFAIFVFSLIVSLLGLLFRLPRLPFGLALLVHYLGSAVSFVLIFVIIISDGKNMRGGFILTALLSVFYWIGGAVAAVVHSKHKKRAEDDRAYKSMFN